MFRLIIWLVILVVSVWVGAQFLNHPGYVFLVYQPWMVQMPLWFAAVATLFLLFVFYFLINSFDWISFLSYRFSNWLRFRREHRAYSKTQHGLALLIEGRYRKAEKLLLAGVKRSIEPLMNYLAAAKAAQEQKEFARRDAYLRKAYVVEPKAELVISLTAAELRYENHELQEALVILNRLRESHPKHPRVLKLLEKIYIRLGDFENLRLLLPAMRKARLLDRDQVAQFEIHLYVELLRQANDKTLDELNALWNSAPRYARKNKDVVLQYATKLYRFKQYAEIEELIRRAMKYDYSSPLVTLFGKLPSDHLQRQLVMAGAWLKNYGEQPELLLLLGNICKRMQLWGKAKDYYQRCLAIKPNPEATLELADLLKELGDEALAMKTYREGLLQAAVLD